MKILTETVNEIVNAKVVGEPMTLDAATDWLNGLSGNTTQPVINEVVDKPVKKVTKSKR